MKRVKIQLWVNPDGGDRGQKSRPCFVECTVNPIGSKTLYTVNRITDAKNGVEYNVEKTLSMNESDFDEVIARSDPTQVKFAARELGVDLKKGGAKIKKMQPRIKKVMEDEEIDFDKL